MEEIESNEIFLLMGIGLIALLSLAIGVILIFFFSEKKYLSLEISNQKDILQTMLETQEKERNRLAKDLHDSITSKLNIVFLYLQQLDQYPNPQAKYNQVIGIIKETINNSISESRRLAHDLLPPTLEEFGLLEALKEASFALNALDSVKVTVDIHPQMPTVFPKNIELNIFRIFQELLNNSMKHGHAQNINLLIEGDDEILKMTYIDDGRGFDAQEIKSGLGLKSINSRVQLMNSKWSFHTNQGKGFKADFEINHSP